MPNSWLDNIFNILFKPAKKENDQNFTFDSYKVKYLDETSCLNCEMLFSTNSPDYKLEFPASYEELQYEYHDKWEIPIIPYFLKNTSNELTKKEILDKAVNLTMSAWENVMNLKLEPVSSEEKSRIIIIFTEHDLTFDKNPDALAYANFPGSIGEGKIVINDRYVWSLDGKPKFINGKKVDTYNLFHVLLHEIGHSLGLTHSIKFEAAKSVMSAKYNNITTISDYDRYRISKKYGKSKFTPGQQDRFSSWSEKRMKRFKE